MDQYASDDHHGMEWNLTKMRSVLSIRCLPSAVDFIFFSDEKIFTVAATVSLQNDRVYTVNPFYSVQIKIYLIQIKKNLFKNLTTQTLFVFNK